MMNLVKLDLALIHEMIVKGKKVIDFLYSFLIGWNFSAKDSNGLFGGLVSCLRPNFVVSNVIICTT